MGTLDRMFISMQTVPHNLPDKIRIDVVEPGCFIATHARSVINWNKIRKCR